MDTLFGNVVNSASHNRGKEHNSTDSEESQDYSHWGPLSLSLTISNHLDQPQASVAKDETKTSESKSKFTPPFQHDQVNLQKAESDFEILNTDFEQAEEIPGAPDVKETESSSSYELLFDLDDDDLDLYLPEQRVSPSRKTPPSSQGDSVSVLADLTASFLDGCDDITNPNSSTMDCSTKSCDNSKQSLSPEQTGTHRRPVKQQSYYVSQNSQSPSNPNCSETKDHQSFPNAITIDNSSNEYSNIAIENHIEESCQDMSGMQDTKEADLTRSKSGSRSLDKNNGVEISILASESSFLFNADDSAFSTPQKTSSPKCSKISSKTEDNVSNFLDDSASVREQIRDGGADTAVSDKEYADVDHNRRTTSLLSSDDYDESGDDSEDTKSSSSDLSFEDDDIFHLTIDELHDFKRSCASSCSSVGDFDTGCSEEIANIIANASLSDLSCTDEDDDDGDSTEPDDIKTVPEPTLEDNKKDRVVDHNETKSTASTNTSNRWQSRTFGANTPRDNSGGLWSSLCLPHQQREILPNHRNNTSAQNDNEMSRKRGFTHNRHSRASRKLFDPYADRKHEPPTPRKRPWRPPPRKREECHEDWPSLPDGPSPEKPGEEAKQQQAHPPTYAEVLTTPPKPKPKAVPPLVLKPVLSNNPICVDVDGYCSPGRTTKPLTLGSFVCSPINSSCPGELLISNSRDPVRLYNDGTVAMGCHTDVLNIDQQDPAIVAIGSACHIVPDGSSSRRVVNFSQRPDQKVDILSFFKNKITVANRPDVQQEDPAILGAQICSQQPITILSPAAHTLASHLPRPLTPIPRHDDRPQRKSPQKRSKRNAMFDDPAIIYADRRKSPTTPPTPKNSPTQHLIQTGFWSVHEDTPCSTNTFVDSNPLMLHQPSASVTPVTYSAAYVNTGYAPQADVFPGFDCHQPILFQPPEAATTLNFLGSVGSAFYRPLMPMGQMYDAESLVSV